MSKYVGTRYNSRWDAGTWVLVILVAAACLWPLFLDDGPLPALISLGSLVFILLTFVSVYYRIAGNKLVVYTFFIPHEYPIDKIKEIRPTRTILSAPAAALTHRIAITFTDRSVMRSAFPLVISPTRLPQFMAQLQSINPGIKYQPD